MAAQSRQWAQKNPSKRALTTRKSRQKSYDRYLTKLYEWRERNPDRVKEIKAKAIARRPWCTMLSHAKYRSKRDRAVYTLTHEWAQQVWTGRCAITGFPFSKGTRRAHPLSPSIDPTKGYTPSNCRFILNCINLFKGNMHEEQMLATARAIADWSRQEKRS